jgi:hypothetical protein
MVHQTPVRLDEDRHTNAVPSAAREPVRTVADLNALDTAEMVAGYWDARAGDPEPGDNRSRCYWHGWRNGAVDGGHRKKDDAQAALAAEVVAANRRGVT